MSRKTNHRILRIEQSESGNATLGLFPGPTGALVVMSRLVYVTRPRRLKVVLQRLPTAGTKARACLPRHIPVIQAPAITDIESQLMKVLQTSQARVWPGERAQELTRASRQHAYSIGPEVKNRNDLH